MSPSRKIYMGIRPEMQEGQSMQHQLSHKKLALLFLLIMHS